MDITFLGAAKTVTGSCYLIKANGKKLLVDCGLFQGHGDKSLNEEVMPISVDELDYILLTHCHIDHSGRIPKLYKDGFKGQIIATKATVELCELLLPDSGHIQEMEYEWINRKRMRAGMKPSEPLYTFQDAVDCLKLFKKVCYDVEIKVDEHITVKYRDAGHILGSSILEMWINENGKQTKIVFSGDLGNKGIPILRDPTIIESADYLLLESTYGNRLHKDIQNRVDRFVDIILETIDKGGNVVIPSFAVGRTQEIIYEINKQLSKYGEKAKRLFGIPVYIDSPLAISATEVYRQNVQCCYDEEAIEYIENGDNPLEFPNLKFTKTSEESKMLNIDKERKIIISASGMCEAGRIKHHLKHNLWRRESTVLFVGYQAEGTLGRRILDGAKSVKIFGEEISIECKIETIEGFSGHADQEGLLEWVSKFKEKPKKIFIVHGEGESQKVLAQKINERFDIECVIPNRGEMYSITAVKEPEISIDRQVQKYSYSRLELLEYINTLEEDMGYLINNLKEFAANETSDNNIENLLVKVKRLDENTQALVKF